MRSRKIGPPPSALALALALALGAPAALHAATPAPADSVRPPARPPVVADTAALAARAAVAPDTAAADTAAADTAAPPAVAVSESTAPAAAAAPGAVLGTSAAAPAAPAARRTPAARILRRPAAGRAGRVRLVVSLADRRLVALQGRDTLLVAPAGIGTGATLRFGARRWRFATPPGRRVVRGKQAAPVWVPPEWHYAELAARRGYALHHLRPDRPAPLGRGRRLVVRGGRVGVAAAGGGFRALPADEEIVFGRTLYVPPLGTANRRIPGQLGAYRLDLGDGYLIHGTPDEGSVGTPSSHGCVRLAGDALAWVYRHVPVGAPVEIR